MIEKLAPRNQTRLIEDDIENRARRKNPHYGIYAHLLTLSHRLDALERANTEKGEG
jgi:hypothetical protein